MFYSRTNSRVFFILPTIAIGIDEYGMAFFEIAWLFYVIGVGQTGE